MKFTINNTTTATFASETSNDRGTFVISTTAENDGIAASVEAKDVSFKGIQLKAAKVEGYADNDTIVAFEERLVSDVRGLLVSGRKLLDDIRQQPAATVRYELVTEACKKGRIIAAVSSHATAEQVEAATDMMGALNEVLKRYEGLMDQMRGTIRAENLVIALTMPQHVDMLNDRLDDLFSLLLDETIKIDDLIDNDQAYANAIGSILKMMDRMEALCEKINA